jgi:hypothetical protein
VGSELQVASVPCGAQNGTAGKLCILIEPNFQWATNIHRVQCLDLM